MGGETPELNEAGGMPDCKPLTVFGLQFAERNLRAQLQGRSFAFTETFGISVQRSHRPDPEMA